MLLSGCFIERVLILRGFRCQEYIGIGYIECRSVLIQPEIEPPHRFQDVFYNPGLGPLERLERDVGEISVDLHRQAVFGWLKITDDESGAAADLMVIHKPVEDVQPVQMDVEDILAGLPGISD